MFLASPITFPNLGITVDPNPVAFTVFGKDIYWYGIIIALGFLLAVIYMMRRAPVFGLTQDDVLDEVLWAVPIGVICARLYYCIFYWELYADNPISILYIWEGGLAIYGGVIGGAITILVVSRVKKIKTGTMLDIAAMAVLIGQIFGRWGNFMNREAHGARAVFTEQRVDLAAPQLQGDVVVGLDPWEFLRDVQHLDHVFRSRQTHHSFSRFVGIPAAERILCL